MMNDCYCRFYQHHRDALRPGLNPEFCAEITVSMSNGLTLNWMHRADYDIESRFRELGEYLKASMVGAIGGGARTPEETRA